MSRKPRAGEAAKKVTIRATDAERAQWEHSMVTEGCATLSAWIVKTLNARCRTRAREITHLRPKQKAAVWFPAPPHTGK